MHHLFKRVRAHYADSERDRDWAIRNLRWDYAEHGPHHEPRGEDVLKEINGYDVATGEPVPGFAQLADDGSTACGCWIYSGIYADGVNQARRRTPVRRDGVHPGRLGVARVGLGVAREPPDALLARVGRPRGQPVVGGQALRLVGRGRGEVDGLRRARLPGRQAPGLRRPARRRRAWTRSRGRTRSSCSATARAWLFSPSGLLDGPMPTHYEPLESPVENVLYPELQANPAALRWRRMENPYALPGDPSFPHVATTFRLTEQHTAGGMSRWLPWLDELQPSMFAEIDPLLAREHGIEDGDWMTIVSPRAEIEARARVTERIKPLKVDGKVIHQVGLPWHWGFGGPSPGDAANDLVTLSGDPNTSIQESKAFVCNVRAGRKTVGTGLLANVHDAPRDVRANRDHPAEIRPSRSGN